MFKSKSLIAKFLIVVMLLGTVWNPIVSNNLENVHASTLLEIKDIPVGSLVVDNTWQWTHRTGDNYTGTGVSKPIEWIVVDTNSHYKQSHYDNTSMNDHVTLLTNEIIAKYNFNNVNFNSPWHNRTIRQDFLRVTFFFFNK